MYISATPGAGLASGKCITTYFDWHRLSSGHYDARMVRECRSTFQVTRSWTDAVYVDGMQKLGACYATNPSMGTCKSSTKATCSMSFVWSLPNTSSSSRLQTASGSITDYNDPNPTLP